MQDDSKFGLRTVMSSEDHPVKHTLRYPCQCSRRWTRTCQDSGSL